ncbi:beta-galactosidase [Streptomyces sp. MP131-18]|uniref:beta-galactosidase n=1 Tax=Streptomyces sp. MP131-18 TaxID=1857892 RepID=UPI00209B5B39|nr:beta-galactosidase [Streptomyces sp. MP131-18]
MGLLACGDDSTPEQWPEEVWREDVALMREVDVNLVSAGNFSWAWLESREGSFDFGWLDRVIESVQANGIRIALGTLTVVPPAWFSRGRPEVLPVNREGVCWEFGWRGAIWHSSPACREAAVRITTALGERYGSAPAVAKWLRNNEYGVQVPECCCETFAAHFRRWLAEGYTTRKAVNGPWTLVFWGEAYGDWKEIQPPRATPTVCASSQRLDFARFAGDSTLANGRRERELLRELSSGTPVTTNFMVSPTQCDSIGHWCRGREVDAVTHEHYAVAEDDRNHIGLPKAADLARSAGGGRLRLLLEHAVSGVNWQPRNFAKTPGEMARNGLAAHVAPDSGGAMFFQWRAPRFGAEEFRSAMLPHAGTDSRIWQEVVELGAHVRALAPVLDARTAADSQDLDAHECAEGYHAGLFDRHLTVNFSPPDADADAGAGAGAQVPLIRQGTELPTAERADGPFAVPAGAVREVRLDD